MKIKIYVDWENREVYDEKAKEIEIQKRAEERKSDPYAFDEFLSEHLEDEANPYVTLFNASEESRAEVRENWENDCVDWAKDDFIDETEEFEIEV